MIRVIICENVRKITLPIIPRKIKPIAKNINCNSPKTRTMIERIFTL